MHREILSKKANFTSKPSLFARKKSWNRNKLSNRKNFAKIDDLRYCFKRFSAPKNLEEEEHLLAFIFISVFFKSFGAFFQENNVLLFSYPKRSFYGNYRQTWTNKQRWTRLDNITQDWYITWDENMHQETKNCLW